MTVDVASSSWTSVNERLARARVEDLRRHRNLQSRQQVEAGGATESASSPSSTTPIQSVVPSSSSARAGLLFLSSTRLAQTEREEKRRNTQLNRQVAGPIPPASWQDEFERLSLRKGINTIPHRTPQSRAKFSLKDAHRKRIMRSKTCAALRHFVSSSHERSETQSLRDMTLCIIADTLNQPDDTPSVRRSCTPPRGHSDRERALEVLQHLPSHMRDRLMALCGRLAQTEYPLSDGTLQALIELHTPARESTTQTGDWQDEDVTHELSPSSSLSLLDLSFASLSMHTWKKWTSPDSIASSLRVLSLANWTGGSDAALDSSAVLTALSQLRNLETLSLAGSALAPLNTDDDHARAGILLRKLGRTLVKLQLLDLSYCHWVSAESLCALPWTAARPMTAFPALHRLLLHGCSAFSVREAGVFSGEWRPAENYVAPWHARHCQIRGRLESSTPRTALVADSFDVSESPTRSTRVDFATYTSGLLRPPTVSDVNPGSHGSESLPTTSVRCPQSSHRIPLWQWQRVCVLDALRGRLHPGSSYRQWVDVWF